MQGLGYWFMQFLLAALTLFLLLVGIDLISGAPVAEGWPMSLAWAVAAAAIFTVSRYGQRKR